MASIQLQGDNSGSLTIQAPSDAGNNTLTLPATSQTLATQNALGVRNLIINGDMRIDQRNAGASITANNQTFAVDRFKFRTSQSSKMTAERSTDVPTGQGFKYSTKITSSSAYTVLSTDFFNMQHLCEVQNIDHLMFGTANAKTVTLSFWVKSSLTGSFSVSLNNLGISPSVYPAEYIINAANTWEKKTITIQGDTSGTYNTTPNSAGLGVIFNLGFGSSFQGTKNSWNSTDANTFSGAVNLVETNGATLYITGVQLEVGEIATPFEHRPYDMELARCQRYYFKDEPVRIKTYSVSGSNNSVSRYNFPTTMRASPTITITTGTTSNLSSASTNQTSISGTSITLIASAAGTVAIGDASDGAIELSAEL